MSNKRPSLKFEVFQDRRKKWRWRLRSTYNGKTVCQSEAYNSKVAATQTCQRIRANAQDASIVDG